MKNIIKSILYLQMTALFLTVALVGAGAADKSVPFKGFIQTAEILDFSGFPTAITSSAIVTGNASISGVLP